MDRNLKSNNFMGENLKKFQHQQWGSIGGYANEIHLAVLKDEVEELKTRIEPHDTGHIHTTISTLNHRIEEISSLSHQSTQHPNELHGPGPDEEK